MYSKEFPSQYLYIISIYSKIRFKSDLIPTRSNQITDNKQVKSDDPEFLNNNNKICYFDNCYLKTFLFSFQPFEESVE